MSATLNVRWRAALHPDRAGPGCRAIAVVALVALAVACSDPSQSGARVKIGVLLPYTGEASALSANLEKGSLLAVDEMNQAGGVGGVPVEVIFGNTFSDPERAVEEARTLLEQGARAIIGPGEDEVAPALFDVLVEAGVPLFSPLVSAVAAGVGTEQTPWFRMAPTPRVLGQNLAQQVGDRGNRSVAIVVADDGYHAQLADAFRERVGLYASVDYSVSVDEANLDVRAISAELAAKMDEGLQGVMLGLHPRLAARLATEFSALRGGAPLPQWYLTPRLKTDVLLQNASPGALEGALGIAPEVFAATRYDFEAVFQRREGDIPFDSTFFMFDATSVTLLAMDRAVNAGSALPEGIADAIVEVASFGGTLISWRDFARARAVNELGGDMYYVGLTGPVSLAADGSRAIGTSSTWAVEGGVIVDR